MSKGAFKQSWADVRKRSGIEGLTFHDLRREAGSMFAEAGLTDPEHKLMMGHDSGDMTGLYVTELKTIQGKLDRYRLGGKTLEEASTMTDQERAKLVFPKRHVVRRPVGKTKVTTLFGIDRLIDSTAIALKGFSPSSMDRPSGARPNHCPAFHDSPLQFFLRCRFRLRSPANKRHKETVNHHKYDANRCGPRRPFLRKHTASDAPSETETRPLRLRNIEASAEEPIHFLLRTIKSRDMPPVANCVLMAEPRISSAKVNRDNFIAMIETPP
jgi:hypothetical protein